LTSSASTEDLEKALFRTPIPLEILKSIAIWWQMPFSVRTPEKPCARLHFGPSRISELVHVVYNIVLHVIEIIWIIYFELFWYFDFVQHVTPFLETDREVFVTCSVQVHLGLSSIDFHSFTDYYKNKRSSRVEDIEFPVKQDDLAWKMI
jgi:hypothetical protein